jgi:hypothetical protein
VTWRDLGASGAQLGTFVGNVIVAVIGGTMLAAIVLVCIAALRFLWGWAL